MWIFCQESSLISDTTDSVTLAGLLTLDTSDSIAVPVGLLLVSGAATGTELVIIRVLYVCGT